MTLAAPVFLLLAAAATVPPPPAVDLEGSVQRHGERWVSLLDQPQVACVLGELAPAGEIHVLQQRMHRTQARHWGRDVDGGFLTTGSIRGTGPYIGRLPGRETGHAGFLLVRLHDNLLVMESAPTPYTSLAGIHVRKRASP